MSDSTARKSVYEVVTDRILALLDQGTVPWKKPWAGAEQAPRSLATGRPYRGVNVFLLTFTMTILHLRHSHVWLPFTGLAGRILQSPAHHQIHHSTNPKHFNKNLGFGMSICM